MGGESRQVCDKVGMGSVAGEGRDVGGEVGGEGGGGGGQVLISHSREVTDRGRSPVKLKFLETGLARL